MPEGRPHAIVTNTTPLIALAIATGELDALRAIYQRVVVPVEVEEELRAGGVEAFGIAAFERADWLERRSVPVNLPAQLPGSWRSRGDSNGAERGY